MFVLGSYCVSSNIEDTLARRGSEGTEEEIGREGRKEEI